MIIEQTFEEFFADIFTPEEIVEAEIEYEKARAEGKLSSKMATGDKQKKKEN